MNTIELHTELEKLSELEFVQLANSFLSRSRRRNAMNYLRPVSEDVVLYTSLRNASSEPEAHMLAKQILDFATKHWSPSSRPLTKISGFNSGPKWADSLIVLAPSVAEIIVGQAYFLVPRTYACYLANQCEATGEETQAEATVREGSPGFNDVARSPAPVIFCRYKLNDGTKSARHFAIGSASEVIAVIERADIKGGSIEIENFERASCVLTAAGQNRGFDVTVAGSKRTQSVADTIATVNQFTRYGTTQANPQSST